MKCTALYLIYNDWSESNYKVGISSYPARRLGEIAVTYQVEPRLLNQAWFTSKSAAQKAEVSWHRFLSEFRTDDHGGDEWFALDRNTKERISDWCNSSRNFNGIMDWAFQAPVRELRNYDWKMLRSIPYTKKVPSIDVWTNQQNFIN